MFKFTTQAFGNCVDREVATLSCLPILFQNVINALFGLAGVVALTLIIWSGIKYATSQGDTNKIDSARKTLTWAIGGLIFIVFSFFLLSLVGKFTGVRQLPGGGN